MNYIKRFIKRVYAKYLKSVRYTTNQTPENNHNERICKSICYRMINNPHSKFLIAPLSGKRYIKNEVLKVFIILDDKKVTITNHIYHYDVILTQRDFDRVSHMYDNKTEEIRNEFENEMMSQIVVSLSTILHKISEKI
jgi:hypothetical protein